MLAKNAKNFSFDALKSEKPLKKTGGMQMWTILKVLGGYSQIIGEDIPPSPPCFGTPG